MDFESYCNLELDIENRYHRFQNAEKFCRGMGFVSLSFNPNRGYKYAYGSRLNVKGIDFICLNTEWDFWGKKDKKTAINRLRIGLKNYKEATDNFNDVSVMVDTPARFVVYHRPLDHLHEYEQFMDPSTYGDKCIENLINSNTDVSLTGHDHTSGIYKKGAHTCIAAGAVYSNDTWRFSSNLIAVPQPLENGQNDCEICQFSYHPSDPKTPWKLDVFGSKKNLLKLRKPPALQVVMYFGLCL